MIPAVWNIKLWFSNENFKEKHVSKALNFSVNSNVKYARNHNNIYYVVHKCFPFSTVCLQNVCAPNRHHLLNIQVMPCYNIKPIIIKLTRMTVESVTMSCQTRMINKNVNLGNTLIHKNTKNEKWGPNFYKLHIKRQRH